MIVTTITAVAVAFEEMRTPYASGREICAQKFENAYKRKEMEKRMPHFVFCLRHVETESRFFFAYAVRIASMILHTAIFLCVLYAEICVNAILIITPIIMIMTIIAHRHHDHHRHRAQ